jgi:uncharacterized membrane protein YqjE
MSDSFKSHLLESVQRFVDTGMDILHTRLELLSVEFHEEKCRLLETLIWVSVSLFLAAIAVIVTLITIIFIAWESREARVWALIILSVASIGSAVFCFTMFRKRLNESNKPFSASLEELRKDREWLSTRN